MNSIGHNMDQAQKSLLSIEGTKKNTFRVLLIFWVLSTGLLIIRIMLEALGSDSRSLFAPFLYFLTSVFLFPFFGIFPHYIISSGRPSFDAPAFTAIICYTILVLIALSVTYFLTKIIKTRIQVTEEINKEKYIDPSESEDEIK